MKRALQLSLMGGPNVSPNPYVGAVVVAGGKIIGEGYHRRFGEAHAEVNAINSVMETDRHLLAESTMYVTLEPCSHYGKTPPCADLIINVGIPRVCVATEDPFLKRHESGIEKMRNAGIEVELGMMGEEARFVNRRFFTAHTLKRPYILLKWACSADGYMAAPRNAEKESETYFPIKFSTPFTQMLMHRERSLYDAIMVGADTVRLDNPRLNCRLWPCRNNGKRPHKVSFESERILGLVDGYILKSPRETLENFMKKLYRDYGITSLMVEGGSSTLNGFIDNGLFDEMRIETSPINLGKGIAAPDISHLHIPVATTETVDGNTIRYLLKTINYQL